jgi:hypothetical protein
MPELSLALIGYPSGQFPATGNTHRDDSTTEAGVDIDSYMAGSGVPTAPGAVTGAADGMGGHVGVLVAGDWPRLRRNRTATVPTPTRTVRTNARRIQRFIAGERRSSLTLW